MLSYNKHKIFVDSIKCFAISSRNKNDELNKLRESIIGAIINNKIPNTFYELEPRWTLIKTSVFNYIDILTNKQQYNCIDCIHTAGRNHKYDFEFNIDNKKYNIEFKFNISKICEAPQFVSPTRPDNFLNISYDEYFYENYLLPICYECDIDIPDKNIYLSQIHNNKPPCVDKLLTMYYNGCKRSSKFTGDELDIQFYNNCKALSKDSIIKFIDRSDVELNINKLSKYLIESQQNKIYMMYDVQNNNFNIEYPNMNDYKLVSYTKNSKRSRFDCISQSGKKMKVLLRWKNGNGIAFPAFQIK